MSGDILISCRDLAKDYHMGNQVVHALDGIDVDIRAGEFVAVLGPSGSGKSTFMNMLGALDQPSRGSLTIDGEDIQALDRDELAALRNRTIGFVFQQFNLLARTSALGNVALPLVYGGVDREEQQARALAVLEKVKLRDRADHRPSQLSGGQQQRVAIARALINDPKIILADEPTGALDTATGKEIMELLATLNREKSITIILVTHEPEVAAFARRQLHFRDGHIVEENSKTVAAVGG